MPPTFGQIPRPAEVRIPLCEGGQRRLPCVMSAVMHPFRVKVEAGDIDGMVGLLAEDVVFHSPVVFRPYQGRDAVATILRAAFETFEGLRYVREIGSDDASDHALVFQAGVAGRQVEGCDFIHVDESGAISEFTVMVRPLSGLLALGEAMKARLEAAARD
jgi:hypothetical protein